MIKDVHYSLQIDRRMKPLVTAADFEGLLELVYSFSHSQFRTAVYMLGERYAMDLPRETFWELFALLLMKVELSTKPSFAPSCQSIAPPLVPAVLLKK